MVKMQRLPIFVAVVETGNFTRAANALGLTRAVVSANIKQLELELGVSLLTRSTRQVNLTQTGERFYHRCLSLLQETENILADVRRDHQGLSGVLRITTTAEYGTQRVVPALALFSAQHPNLQIHHVSSSHTDDLIAGRFDLAIRLGRLCDSTHHAKQIDQFAIYPVASPGYLSQRDGQEIKSLDQLADATWIGHSRLITPLRWQVLTPRGDNIDFYVRNTPRIFADSAASLLEFALQGLGVALLPAWLITEQLSAGRLLKILPNYHFPPQGIYAIYPHTQHIPGKVRHFIDFLTLHNKKLIDKTMS